MKDFPLQKRADSYNKNIGNDLKVDFERRIISGIDGSITALKYSDLYNLFALSKEIVLKEVKNSQHYLKVHSDDEKSVEYH